MNSEEATWSIGVTQSKQVQHLRMCFFLDEVPFVVNAKVTQLNCH